MILMLLLGFRRGYGAAGIKQPDCPCASVCESISLQVNYFHVYIF